MTTQGSSTARRTDLDWLRVGAFIGLIFYHEGLLYADRHPQLEFLLLTTHPWRMSLLFLISGAATRFMADKFTAGKLSAERSLKLLPPLIFAVLAFIPIQAYLTLVENTPYALGYLDFLKGYFSAPNYVEASSGGSQTLPFYGHMWFVFYLWTYTVVLAGALALAPRLFQSAQRALERGLSGLGLLLGPFALLVALRLTLFPLFGVTLKFTDDWYNHLVSAGMFLLGFLLARSERAWAEIARARWAGLAMALAGFAVYGLTASRFVGKPEWVELSHPGMTVFYELERWGALIALLGFSRRHMAESRPQALRYLNGGIFTYYIVHEPAMLLWLHWLKPLNFHVLAEAGLVAAGTVATCALAYELARRMNWLGVLLGKNPLPLPQFYAKLSSRAASRAA